jgi:hypothetical protein
MIYLHKEHALEPMQRRYPAPHYVMIDDKPLLLAAMKRAMGEKLTTVFVRQGHYATEAAGAAIDPAPDLCIDRIAQLNDFDASDFSGALGHAPRRNEEHV